MVIAIGIVAAVVLCWTNIFRPRRMDRSERLGLNLYARKERCEGSLPFDYLSR